MINDVTRKIAENYIQFSFFVLVSFLVRYIISIIKPNASLSLSFYLIFVY